MFRVDVLVDDAVACGSHSVEYSRISPRTRCGCCGCDHRLDRFGRFDEMGNPLVGVGRWGHYLRLGDNGGPGNFLLG